MKLFISIFLISQFTISYSQDSCKNIIGSDWKTIHFNFNNGKETVFEGLDTIKFHKPFNRVYPKRVDYGYLQLNCSDSSFQIVNVDTIVLLDDNGKKEIITIAGTSDNGNGIFKLNIRKSTISFKLNILNKWYHYNLTSIGSKGKNPFIIYTSTGDYRYLITLFKEE